MLSEFQNIVEKIREGRVLSAEEIHKILPVIIEKVANEIFVSGKCYPGHEIMMRTPAVFFSEISQSYIDSLKGTIAHKIRMYIVGCKSITSSQNIYSTLKAEDSWLGVYTHALQQIFWSGNALGHEFYVAGLVKEVAFIFRYLWKQGIAEGWNDIADKDRLRYYGGNVSASFSLVK